MNDDQFGGIDAVPSAGTRRSPAEQMGDAVRSLRRQLGMTQEELAQSLGITVGTVSRWEKGRFRPSRLARALIIQFARAHNLPLNGGAQQS
jgi:DNA-binding transcriptional regulator YiaG